MILILSTNDDAHALAVLRELTEIRREVRVLDLSAFPQRVALNARFSNVKSHLGLGCNSDMLDFEECGAVWWRRPQTPRISPRIHDERDRLFAFNECQEALAGVWPSLDAFWINDPMRDQAAHRKLYQLRVARDVGLRVPETLVSNCPTSARAFLERLGPTNVIYKPFAATAEDWRETRLLRENEAELLHLVRLAPVIFQEFVPAICDLRVTIVGDQIFPAAIYSPQGAYEFDCRMELGNCRIEATTLPPGVAASLRDLMQRLGIVYGAVDLRRTGDGEHVFLEVNPAGQWLFIEVATQQPIARAVASLLAEHDA